MEEIIEYTKVQGLIGETSFSIVLPKAYAMKLGIEKGNFVKVHQDGSKIIVEKAEA
jgi:bifunctional DNA-binding transcriptional regulator/antitoxin component of YhaV-PrlF toxin-antitoxin module